MLMILYIESLAIKLHIKHLLSVYVNVNFLSALQALHSKQKSKVVPKIFHPLVYMSCIIPWTVNLIYFTLKIRLCYMA